MPLNRQSIPGVGTWVSTKNSFVGTAATREVPSSGIKLVAPVHNQAVNTGSIATQDQPLTVAETLRDDGLVEVNSVSEFTIERSASGTSNLPVITTFIGTGNNRHFITGYGTLLRSRIAFSGTDATVEADCGGLSKVRVIGLQMVTPTFGARDAMVVDETPDSNGYVTPSSSGTITIRRSANSPPSGSTGLVHMTDGDTARIPGMGTIFTTHTNFSTTDETVEVGCKGYKRVLAFSVIPFNHTVGGVINENDQTLTVDETTDSDGVIQVQEDNMITIRRFAGGGSGTPISVNMIGY